MSSTRSIALSPIVAMSDSAGRPPRSGMWSAVATSRAMIAGSAIGREVDPSDARVSAGVRGRDLARESRLAAAAGAGEREQSRRADQPRELAQLMAATDEPRQVDG